VFERGVLDEVLVEEESGGYEEDCNHLASRGI
jgi:hypothetical protein